MVSIYAQALEIWTADAKGDTMYSHAEGTSFGTPMVAAVLTYFMGFAELYNPGGPLDSPNNRFAQTAKRYLISQARVREYFYAPQTFTPNGPLCVYNGASRDPCYRTPYTPTDGWFGFGSLFPNKKVKRQDSGVSKFLANVIFITKSIVGLVSSLHYNVDASSINDNY